MLQNRTRGSELRPFADHRRLITGVAAVGEGLLVAVEGATKKLLGTTWLYFTVRMAREGPRWRWRRSSSKSMPSRASRSRWGFDQQAAVTAHGLSGVVVGHHDDDVGTPGTPRCTARAASVSGITQRMESRFAIFRSVIGFGVRKDAGCARAGSPMRTPQSYTSRGAGGSTRLRNGGLRPD